MKPIDYEKWKVIREKGKLRYFIFAGSLGFLAAMGTALGMKIANSPNYAGLLTISTLISVVIWVAGGFFGGIATWLMNESLFRQHSSPRNDT